MCELPPPNQKQIEQEFYDFIQRPENRGFNTAFAQWRGDEGDSYVSRMHSPFVPEVKSWLYKAALQLFYAFKARPAVGRKALNILNSIGAMFSEQKPASEKGLDASYYAFKAALAAYEDGDLSREEFERARTAHLDVTLRVGLPEKMPQPILD